MKAFPCKYMAIGWLLSAASLSGQAAPYFTNKEGDLIWDKATGLVWMRCSLGQTWDGKTCTGELRDFNFEKAREATRTVNSSKQYAGGNWEIPSVRQLVSLRDCRDGFVSRIIEINDGKAFIPQQCKSWNLGDAQINLDAFPATPDISYYLSASPSSHYKWVVGYDAGSVREELDHFTRFYVRLVRARPLSSIEAVSVFAQSPQEHRQAMERKASADKEAAVREAKFVREAFERKINADREEAERKVREARAQALKQLLGLGSRGLYLEAGKAQRNGPIILSNTRFEASELYEMIIANFPDSEYAVKATDQLTAMSRSSREQSVAREAANRATEAANRAADAQRQSDSNANQRAYEACKIEMNSCFSRTDGKGNCYRDCERLR